jgi:chemotaxis-related protein WspD
MTPPPKSRSSSDLLTTSDVLTTQRRASLSRLLDREVSEDYLREWSAHVAAEQNVVQVGTRSAVIFRVGAEWLALPTGVFQEVSERSTIRTLPHHRGGILSGLVNIRGELVLCVSLEALLGLEKAAEKKESSPGRLLICKPVGGRIAFPVSEVHGVHHYHPGDLRPSPATLTKAAGVYIVNVLPWKDRTVGCLDDELLFYALDKGIA